MKTVLEELQAIEAREGILKPESVVEYARNPKTTLHSKFEWDDGKAADQWRLQQARQIIIHVQVEIMPNTQQMTRAFVSLKDDRYNGSGYRNIASVLSDDEMRRHLLEEAMEDARTFRKRYSSLKELEAVFVAMEEAQEHVAPVLATTAA